MAKVNSVQSNFLLGEVSDRALGNTQDETYSFVCSKLLNAMVTDKGTLRTRPGSQAVDFASATFNLESSGSPIAAAITALNGGNRSGRLIPYSTSDGIDWLLGFPDNFVYKTSTNTLYPLLNRYTFYVRPGIYSYIQNPPTYVPSTMDCGSIQSVQSGNTVFITSAAFAPITVIYDKTGHYNLTPANNFNFPMYDRYDMVFRPNVALTDELDFHRTVPLLEENINDNYGQGSITTASGFGLGSSATLVSSAGIFTNAWVGSYIRLNNYGTNKSALLYVTSYISATQVSAYYVSGQDPTGATLFGTAANSSWQESAWSPRNGYPKAVGYHDGRVIYASTTRNPNRIWFSAVGDADELHEVPFIQDAAYATYTADDSRAFYRDIVGAEDIRWISTERKILVGSASGVFSITGSDGTVSPSTISVIQVNDKGAAVRQPVKMDNILTYVGYDGESVHGIVYSYMEDSYTSVNITNRNENIVEDNDNLTQHSTLFDKGLHPFTAVKYRDNYMLWGNTGRGLMVSITYNKEKGAFGIARHFIGGTPPSTIFKNPAVFATAAVYKTNEYYFSTNAQAGYPEIYMLVHRKVGGSDVTVLEKIGKTYERLDLGHHESTLYPAHVTDWLAHKPIYLDGARGAYSLGATTTFTIAALANQTVHVTADGKYLGELTFDGSGTIVLPTYQHSIIAGYKYDTNIETAPLELRSESNASNDKYKRIPETWLKIYRSCTFKVRKKGQTEWQTFTSALDSTPSDAALPRFTGDKRFNVGGVDRSFALEIRVDQPVPFELLAIVLQGIITD